MFLFFNASFQNTTYKYLIKEEERFVKTISSFEFGLGKFEENGCLLAMDAKRRVVLRFSIRIQWMEWSPTLLVPNNWGLSWILIETEVLLRLFVDFLFEI